MCGGRKVMVLVRTTMRRLGGGRACFLSREPRFGHDTADLSRRKVRGRRAGRHGRSGTRPWSCSGGVVVEGCCVVGAGR